VPELLDLLVLGIGIGFGSGLGRRGAFALLDLLVFVLGFGLGRGRRGAPALLVLYDATPRYTPHGACTQVHIYEQAARCA
jgi:hypothetical protein